MRWFSHVGESIVRSAASVPPAMISKTDLQQQHERDYRDYYDAYYGPGAHARATALAAPGYPAASASSYPVPSPAPAPFPSSDFFPPPNYATGASNYYQLLQQPPVPQPHQQPAPAHSQYTAPAMPYQSYQEAYYSAPSSGAVSQINNGRTCNFYVMRGDDCCFMMKSSQAKIPLQVPASKAITANWFIQ